MPSTKVHQTTAPHSFQFSALTLHAAHAADQIQNALNLDHTGPVEIWPTSKGLDARGRMRYADGKVVRFKRDCAVYWGRCSSVIREEARLTVDGSLAILQT